MVPSGEGIMKKQLLEKDFNYPHGMQQQHQQHFRLTRGYSSENPPTPQVMEHTLQRTGSFQGRELQGWGDSDMSSHIQPPPMRNRSTSASGHEMAVPSRTGHQASIDPFRRNERDFREQDRPPDTQYQQIDPRFQQPQDHIMPYRGNQVQEPSYQDASELQDELRDLRTGRYDAAARTHLDPNVINRSGRRPLDQFGRADSLSSDQSESMRPPPPKPHKNRRGKNHNKQRQHSLSSSEEDIQSTPEGTSGEDVESAESVSEKGKKLCEGLQLYLIISGIVFFS